jgi:formylmethanofuran dehydrogenase subunit A
MLAILGGQVYDPLNGIHGQVRDLWVRDGRLVEAIEVDRERAEILDARGLVVLPGGVDIHSHVAGPTVNAGRLMRPEDGRAEARFRTEGTRSGVGRTVPTAHLTGYRYAEMGYTTVMEAAVPPLMARHTHEDLGDLPLVDKGTYVLMANNRFLLGCLRDGQQERARDFVAWLLQAARGYAIKICNAGGMVNWEYGVERTGLDDPVRSDGPTAAELTPREIIARLAEISAELGLPHGPHIHTNCLGQRGNATTTLATIAALEDRRAHLCHLQFASYGGGKGRPLRSAAAEVARAVEASPNLTCDIGQVVFGPATTMTADAPLEYRLHRLTGGRWLCHDVEEETKGGVVPMTYRRGNPTNAVQWCIGLELLLLIRNPWRVFLTTDHPNGGPFTAYPEIIRLVMDRGYRQEVLVSLPPVVRRRTTLAELDREYTLSEIAISTRAGPARALGLAQKGHLGPGADADIALYAPQANQAAMFARVRHLVKDGQVVIRDGELLDTPLGSTWIVEPTWDRSLLAALRPYFETTYTISLDNYPVQDVYLPRRRVVPCA